jgi:hypothetical protein
MKKIIRLVLAFFSLYIFIIGCALEPPQESSYVEYHNLVILSDLSNRLDAKPMDTVIINQFLSFFENDCVMPGVKINDRSSISFSRINDRSGTCQKSKIDLCDFSNTEVSQKQRYVNSSDALTPGLKTLKGDLKAFRKNVQCTYGERDVKGLDILSLVFDKLNRGSDFKKNGLIHDEVDTTHLVYHNHLILFTDGYLEYSTGNGNGEFYFGDKQIKAVRQFCKTNRVTPEEAISQNIDFQIRPLRTETNESVNLYVLETADRGFDSSTGTFRHTGDLSDNYILMAVWKHWAKESGFKSFTWKPTEVGNTISKEYVKRMISDALVGH